MPRPPARLFSWLYLPLLFALALSSFSPARAETHVQLILDASGSMFNKLADGRYRIVAAKEVLAELIAGIPAADDLHVGLRVYGSQLRGTEPGACEDSRLFVPMEGLARQALLDAVQATQARGATPIAYSLQLAAEDFVGLSGKKLIVLVTDGEEACGGDVRAAAAALKAAGVDIDLRIIGFDLTDAAIRSFEGVGTFENATSAAELLAALNRAVEVVREPAATTAPISYRVTVTLTRDGEPALEGATVAFQPSVTTADTATTGAEAEKLHHEGKGVFRADLPAGSYTAQLADAYSDQPLLVPGLTVTPEGPNSFAFELAPQLTVTLTPETDTPDAGARLTVAWSGAPASGGYLGLGPEDEPFEFFYEAAAGASGEVAIQLPAVAGAYELRFLIDLPEGGDSVIGRALLDVQEVSASLEAPDEVTAGSRIEVSWTGPDNSDDGVTLVPIGSEPGLWWQFVPTSDGSPLTLTAPDFAGSYELRYLASPDVVVLARREITVVEATVEIRAPASAKAGSEVPIEIVRWSGNPDDGLTLLPVGWEEGDWRTWLTVTGEGTVDFQVTDIAGDYEIRYLSGQSTLTLARLPLTLTPVTASISGPAWVSAGEMFTVHWQGEDLPGDFVTIVEASAEEGDWGYSLNTSDGNPLQLGAPDEPGKYELRYVTGQSYLTLARTPIEVR